MSGTTSVPVPAFTDKGFVAPAESAIVTGLDADYNAAFGGNLNTDPSTPQGQLIASTAAMLGDCYDQETLLFNSVDPAFASGRMQDAIARIYFLARDPAQSTVLQIICVGLQGVQILGGATVVDPEGNLFVCNGPGVIPASGTITLPFASQAMAPIPVPATVAIYQTIPNWNTATVMGGVVGNLAEGRAAFERRRQATVAANAAGFLAAISGAIGALPDVIDWFATENDTNAAVNVRGYLLAKNSLYVAASGGSDLEVATAIFRKKNPGCSYNGNTTVAVQDTNSGYNPPFPVYNVTFERPIDTAIAFAVTLLNNPGIPANAAVLIQAAIGAAFNGQDGGTRARIASTLFAARYYTPVALLGSWAQIIRITIGSGGLPAAAFVASITGFVMTVTAIQNQTFTGTSTGTTELTIAAPSGPIFPGYAVGPLGVGIPFGTQILYQLSGTTGGAGVYVTNNPTTASAASLTASWNIAVGQFVFGGTAISGLVESGTLITALSTGTGGVGTYTVSRSQTIASEDMLTIAPTLDDVTMGIDQQPTFRGLDVEVVFQDLPS